MKNAMCIGATRLLFIVIQGRMRSIIGTSELRKNLPANERAMEILRQ
jgi:hypothetical protein